MSRPITIRGARVWDTGQLDAPIRDLHCVRGVIQPRARWDARKIDLDGYTVFPALVNAHDHLELNHFPRTRFRERYDNAHQWGEDVSARLDEEPFKSLRAYPLEDRCFIGGLKNLLCGALTVAHHNPPHKCLFERDFPVRVLRNYGWAHSLHFTSESEIVRSYRATPPGAPWFIHLAEGTDAIAAGEYDRLKALGCIGKNTVIVHGVGLGEEAIINYLDRIRGHVLCSTTNQYLLGSYLEDYDVVHTTTWTNSLLAIGSDSRLTADGDLLDEMRFAQRHVFDNGWLGVLSLWYEDSAFCTVSLATCDGARVINAADVGRLDDGYFADYIAIRAPSDTTFGATERALCNSRRADLVLVARGGTPEIGDPDVMAKFPHIQTIPATLDGRPKRIHTRLAHQIARCTLSEPGLELDTDFVAKHIKKA
jgi:hypothetical protein